MPELPEVETARRLIAERALNRPIAWVDDTDTFVCRPHSPGEIRDALAGRMLTSACRRGKLIWCETSGAGPDLGIHLGMTGRIIITTPAGQEAASVGEGRAALLPPRTIWNRFALGFADGGHLVLSDPRRLGRILLNPDVETLGPDAAEVTPDEFRELITRGNVAVKARLLDQSKIAGVGNLLADEALWQAKIPPMARTGSLSCEQADRLYLSLQAVLRAAIASGGAHTGEVIAARYPGATCPRCGAEMRHGTVGGRSTWWCSREQAGVPESYLGPESRCRDDAPPSVRMNDLELGFRG